MKRILRLCSVICVMFLIFACPNITDGIDSDGTDSDGTDGGSATDSTAVAAPVMDPAEGEYDSLFEVTITCATDGAAIYYTIDGSEPSAASNLYENPISIYANTVVKAVAVKDDMDDSSVTQASYTLNPFVAERIAIYFKVQLSYSTDGMWVGGSWVSWSDSDYAIYSYVPAASAIVEVHANYQTGDYNAKTHNGRFFFRRSSSRFTLMNPFTNAFTDTDVVAPEAMTDGLSFFVVPVTTYMDFDCICYRTKGGEFKVQDIATEAETILIGRDGQDNDYSFRLYAYDGHLYSYHVEDETLYVHERDMDTGLITTVVTEFPCGADISSQNDLVTAGGAIYFTMATSTQIDMKKIVIGENTVSLVFSYTTVEGVTLNAYDADIDVCMLELSVSGERLIVIYDEVLDEATEIDLANFTLVDTVQVLRLHETVAW